jgi:hypothetical protein
MAVVGLPYRRLPLLPQHWPKPRLETATEGPSSVVTSGQALPPALLLQQDGDSSGNRLLLQPSEPLNRLGFGVLFVGKIRTRGG